MTDTASSTAGRPVLPTDYDPMDVDFWSHGSAPRADYFRLARDTVPVAFSPEPEIPGMPPPGPGFWSVSRFEDVMHVSRHPDIFSSAKGTNIFDLPDGVAEFMGSMINMDSPRHTRVRMIVNRAFTPRMVARIDDDVRVKARAIVAAMADRGECDIVTDLAAPLPLQIICEMMGIPNEEWNHIFEMTNIILGDETTTPDLETLMGAILTLAQLAQAVGEDRLANPQDDLVSAMMHAEVDGETLSPSEMASFFILLAAAGNETTRNAITHGIKALTDHPDQRAIWQADPENVSATAVEEIVRWATPVIHFRRTATQDTKVAGVPIAEGEKVVMWYESANRDERAFEDPFRFDVTRSPNEHVGFGGGGPHFCLGANLARREIRVMFEELFRWVPDIAASGEPEYLKSSFIHGIKSLPATYTPAAVPALDA